MSMTSEQKTARIMMRICVIIGFLAVLLFIWSLFGETYYISAFTLFIIALLYYNYKQWKKRA